MRIGKAAAGGAEAEEARKVVHGEGCEKEGDREGLATTDANGEGWNRRGERLGKNGKFEGLGWRKRD